MPAATISIAKNRGGGAPPVYESPVTSMQGDTGELYRQVDSKYIHNLDLKALGLRAGLYRVFITIDGQTHEAGSGSFSLKQSTGGATAVARWARPAGELVRQAHPRPPRLDARCRRGDLQ
ncbi:MAG: hypothetical protein H6529_16245 [Nocardioides sp.]|nr:hypothetical protein [Nocardioidaceae bacterium]MCB8958018.1 hypothetical protein [Nocardioides sp.]